MTKNHNISVKNSDGNLVNTGRIEYHEHTTTYGLLNKTRLYEFCEEFVEREDLYDAEYSIKIPSDIAKKIDYNELDEYKEIFSQVSHTIDDVEKILSTLPRRGLIIRRIKGLYLNSKAQNKNVSKDMLCSLVFAELMNTVKKPNGGTALFVEDTYFAIQSIMYYAFTKCQILERIPS